MSSQLAAAAPPPRRNSLVQKNRHSSTGKKSSTPSENGTATSNGTNARPSSPAHQQEMIGTNVFLYVLTVLTPVINNLKWVKFFPVKFDR
nr:CBS domain-containing protein CBSCBSPB3-like isoform X2 [Ipomoea trifida]